MSQNRHFLSTKRILHQKRRFRSRFSTTVKTKPVVLSGHFLLSGQLSKSRKLCPLSDFVFGVYSAEPSVSGHLAIPKVTA